MRPRASYVICTTARSGSNLLASTLAQTGVAGRPQEYFVVGTRDEFLRMGQLHVRDYRDYLRAVVRATTTPNGVCGLNLHAVQGRLFMDRVGFSERRTFNSLREAIETALPGVRYILLTRKDKVAQAVSHYRAVMTGEWRRLVDSAPRTSASDKNLAFNQYGIKKSLKHLENSDAYWEKFFETNRLSPLRLTYEELVADHQGTVRRVFDYLGIPPNTPVPPPGTQKMADERSRLWAEQFVRLEQEDPVIVSPDSKLAGIPF